MRRALFSLAALLAIAAPAHADTYPSRPVTMVVPYAAGGGLDVLARTLAVHLSQSLGKPVIVENRPGAGTTIGAGMVAKATPDGYTIMLGTSSAFAINVTLRKKLPYDPAKDFVPIALVANAPFMLLVNPSLPVHSLAELIAYVKARPGKLSYGSAGPGSPQHLSMELLKTMTGMDVVHIPYKGDAPALTDLVAGHIPLMFGEPTPILPLMKDGKVRALAVSSATRLPTMPDIPTVAEAGVPGFNFVSWQMIVAPEGTPKEIVDRLHVEIKKVIDLPEIKAEYARTARISVDYPPVDALVQYMKSEIVRMGKVVEKAGLKGSQ
jgi:tripartite-type tricarboxylate transporter receptor subunit TctC